MSAINDISKWVCGLSFDRLPPEVIEGTKFPIIDCIGVTVAGLEDPSSRIVTEWIEDMGCAGAATMLHGFRKTTPVWASLANGTAAHALDYDDVDFRMMGHPSVALVPAILALGEAESLSGKDCILAYVIGLEVCSKVGSAIGGNPYVIGWHQTSTYGTLGATAACGKMLGLTEEQLENALGVACSLASGIRSNFGTMTKPYHAGMAAMNGITAAQLAERGFSANSDSMFGENSIAKAFSGDLHREAEVAQMLGNPYDVIDPGLSFKPYPCCRGPQGAIDASLQVHEQLAGAGKANPGHIEHVEVKVPEWLRGVLMYHTPQTGLEGKFSLEFCVTAGLLDGKVGVGQFTDERVQSADVVATIEKFDWQDMQGEGSSPFSADVAVTLKDGTRVIGTAEKPLGEPGNPMSEGQIYDKYSECVKSQFGDKAAEDSLELLKDFDDLDTVGKLIDALQR